MDTLPNIFKNYRSQSRLSIRSVLIVIIISTLVLLIQDLYFGMDETNYTLLSPLLVVSIILLSLSLWDKDSKYISEILIITLYGTIEAHFIVYVESFHALNFWLALLPVVSFILSGAVFAFISLFTNLVLVFVNYAITQQVIGDSYSIIIDVKGFLFIGISFILAVFLATLSLYRMMGRNIERTELKNARIQEMKKKSDYSNSLFEKYLTLIFQLSKSEQLLKGKEEAFFETLCKTAHENLDITAVSLWKLKDNYQELVFIAQSGKEDNIILYNNAISSGEFIATLLNKPYISSTEFTNIKILSTFRENYLEADAIKSFLAVPIILDSRVKGMILCMNKPKFRNWNNEDLLFVQSLSDLVSLTMKNNQVNQLMNEIRDQNMKLKTESQSNKLLNKQLSELNQGLEQKVNKRTEELTLHNEQLSEYAFINSHLLRAPLARILGLSDLILRNDLDEELQELMNALMTSTKELDEIVTHIGQLLYDGHDFSRKHIQEIVERNFIRIKQNNN